MRLFALLIGLPTVRWLLSGWPSWLQIAAAVDSGRPTHSCGGVAHRHGDAMS